MKMQVKKFFILTSGLILIIIQHFSDLPLENWLDFFKLLSREQLAALLPHIGDEHEKVI
jgi:hypothetical protein